MKERKARRAQNPRTLEKVDVPAKRVVKFKVGRLMRQRVCEEPAPPAPPAGQSDTAPPADPRPAQEPKPTNNSPF